MADSDYPVTNEDKMRIASDFIMNSPPGELNAVFNDVRCLIDDDSLINERVTDSIAQYNKHQLTPVKVDDSVSLVTHYNDLGEGRFFDPRSNLTYKYDHFRRDASDIRPKEERDETVEAWRKALEEACVAYTDDHYKGGTCSVFGSSAEGGNITLTACIESHQYQPQNYWNGKWRSVWSVTFSPDGSTAELKGVVKVQVHYYEDGNVQLVTSKEVTESLPITTEKQTANEFVDLMSESENEYQMAVGENYQTMSDTVFKALRRLLPVTRTKVDWSKIGVYKLGTELKN